jgi:hypothetical protein
VRINNVATEKLNILENCTHRNAQKWLTMLCKDQFLADDSSLYDSDYNIKRRISYIIINKCLVKILGSGIWSLYFILFIITTYLSHLCRVLTIIYLKQTMFLGYIVFQLFYSYSVWYVKCYLPC